MKLLFPLLFLPSLLFSQQRFEINTDDIIAQLNAAGGAVPQLQINPEGVEKQPANNKKKQKDPEAFRTELLNKIQFDRTPSGILKEEGLKRRPLEAEPEQKPKIQKNEPEKNPATEKQKEQEKLRKQYQEEVESYRRNVILGNWSEVKDYLANLPESLGKSTYSRLLSELGKPVQVQPRPEVAVMGARRHAQNNYLSVDDVLALSDVAPKELTVPAIESLAKLLPSDVPENFFVKLKTKTRYFGDNTPEAKFRSSSLLINMGRIEEATHFLPELENSRARKEGKELNLVARYHAEAHQKKLGGEHLGLAWNLSLEVMSWEAASINEREEALYRALSLVAELEEGSGQEWLRKTFSDPAGEGFEILAAVGTRASQSQTVREARVRHQQGKLQYGAAEALLGTKGIDPAEWKEIFTIYALNWLKEANLSNRLDNSSSIRPQIQWDNYGNRYFAPREYVQNHNRNQPNPIPTGDIIELAPSEKWIANVDEGVQLQLLEMIPTLYLKVKEHEKAFPHIKKLASFKPDTAKNLIRNMISVWAENHNPNQQSRYRSSYSYFYGYNNRADTIPLTRSKQERNLTELSKLVTSVRELELGESFNEEFADAFITVHSQAEVWRVEALQKVFGETEDLDSETVASLIERMRINLAALWPDPKLQKQAQTKRTDKERHQQVLAGYEMARKVTATAWGNEPESWNLLTQLASLTYEESNYLSALQPQTTHSSTKRTALDDFADAAELYAQSLPLEKESDESTKVYETWFFGALGSPLLETLKNHHLPVQSEFDKIKASLDSLPDKTRERHYESFASTLDKRLANVSPDLKFRYLKAAISVVGEHKAIESASEVFAYYKDLITEIELNATLDGPAEVGTEPFGLFVNIHHTREIERESGGFQRYLQNQNNVSYSYNFGRPTEDYRDKFEKAARAALEENFEVVSLTFHTDKIESRTSARHGWSMTPYAYLLLKARGPQTDTVPPLQIDLDFLDTSGHVVLPISTSNIPIVASATQPRPMRDLKLTMTLDERDAEEKEEWHLEIKTSTEGLVPPLSKLVSLPIEGFEVAGIDDRELQIEELTTESEDGAPLSTHEYRLTLKAENSLPKEFAFPKLTKIATKALASEDAVLRQRYQDVDLLPVGEVISLTKSTKASWTLWLILIVVIAAAVGVWLWLSLRRQPVSDTIEELGPELPENLTAVSLLHWLKRLQTRLSGEKEAELQKEISSLEKHAFSEGGSLPALNEIAGRWKKS